MGIGWQIAVTIIYTRIYKLNHTDFVAAILNFYVKISGAV